MRAMHDAFRLQDLQKPLYAPRVCTLVLFIGSVCLSVCKSHLTYGASVRPENAVTYSAGNEGQKICGVFSENALLLRSSGVAVVFHTFRWPFCSEQKWCACVL